MNSNVLRKALAVVSATNVCVVASTVPTATAQEASLFNGEQSLVSDEGENTVMRQVPYLYDDRPQVELDDHQFDELFQNATRMKDMAEPEQQSSGRRKRSVNCRLIWPTPHELCGAILEKYDRIELKWLGLPTSSMIPNPDGLGWRAHFDNGTIYWTKTF